MNERSNAVENERNKQRKQTKQNKTKQTKQQNTKQNKTKHKTKFRKLSLNTKTVNQERTQTHGRSARKAGRERHNPTSKARTKRTSDASERGKQASKQATRRNRKHTQKQYWAFSHERQK